MYNLSYIIKNYIFKLKLKLAFGEEYDILYPGSFYSPPSYNENFSSAERLKLSMYLFRYFILEDVLILSVRSIKGTQLLYMKSER
jgi:hypothetical protein